jgi:hypothetical protein
MSPELLSSFHCGLADFADYIDIPGDREGAFPFLEQPAICKKLWTLYLVPSIFFLLLCLGRLGNESCHSIAFKEISVNI